MLIILIYNFISQPNYNIVKIYRDAKINIEIATSHNNMDRMQMNRNMLLSNKSEEQT